MPRDSRLSRRLGGLVLLLVWAQVATANALPCGIRCTLEARLGQHVHDRLGEGHAIGHHAGEAKVVAPEFCGTPQLLVVAAVWPDFPTAPSVAVSVTHITLTTPLPVLSSPPEFDPPPPRA